MNYRAIIAAYLVLGVNLSHAAASSTIVSSDSVSFAENSPPETGPELKRHGLGIETQLGDGAGLFYERGVGPRTLTRIEIYYAGQERRLVQPFDRSSTVGNADFSVRNRAALTLGLDRLFFLTNDGRWALIAGGGVGYTRSTSEAKFYPSLCNWLMCGFNPNVVMSSQTIDESSVVALFRTGVRYGGLKVFGQPSDVAITFNIQVARLTTGREFISPDGRRIATGGSNTSTMAFESRLTF